MEHSPTPYAWKPLCPPALFSSCTRKFLRFPSASLEHNASSAERVLPTLVAKIGIISETTKYFGEKTYASLEIHLVEILVVVVIITFFSYQPYIRSKRIYIRRLRMYIQRLRMYIRLLRICRD